MYNNHIQRYQTNEEFKLSDNQKVQYKDIPYVDKN